MKITTNEGEFELVEVDQTVDKNDNYQPLYALKPVKKTEKKEEYYISFQRFHISDERLLDIDLELTPITADKFSEGLKAYVEYVTTEPKSQYVESEHNPDFVRKAEAARESFQESQ